MTKGLKIWLYIVITLNALSALFSLIAGMFIPALECIAAVIGAALILRMKKLGFYIICIMQVVGIIYNLSIGYNIALTVVSAVLMPLIIYLFMRKNWEAFQ